MDPPCPAVEIAAVPAEELERQLAAFAALLQACVHDGAAVSFLLPFPLAESEAFWRQKVLPAVRRGNHVVLAARCDGRLAGSVQLGLEVPPNQPHRAEVSKLLVHPAWRRRGIGRALMLALEAEARRRDRRLLTLDTRTGDRAEPLYLSLGFERCGVIPDYSLDPGGSRLEAATVMYRILPPERGPGEQAKQAEVSTPDGAAAPRPAAP